jgi:GT2 family glycosyltransferase
MKDTAIIIVNWNQTALTLDTLASLEQAGVALEQTWVIDNGSLPNPLPEILTRFPSINPLRLESNGGFAAGCNIGVAAAFQAGFKAAFLLNNDALVETKTLPLLEAALMQFPTAAAVSPKVYFADTPCIIQAVGIEVNPNSGQTVMLGSGEKDLGQYDKIVEREALFGCALLIRREAWEQVGPFWEPFFCYSEEVDWCLRARRLGWKLYSVPQAVVWHRASSSLGRDAPLKIYLLVRNKFYLRQRHRQVGWQSWKGLLETFYWHGRTILRYLRLQQKAQAWAIVLAIWDFYNKRRGNCRTSDLRLCKVQEE